MKRLSMATMLLLLAGCAPRYTGPTIPAELVREHELSGAVMGVVLKNCVYEDEAGRRHYRRMREDLPCPWRINVPAP
jgi:hypothetical protein